jgi:succinate dehydrogenase/fumarate reductase flavoprotein subunit
LRAAIEASAAGVDVGLVCKSLLGKAHTVMAEGGIAAALANVDDRDNWKVHFSDTMRGGQYVNNWRMAEIHAKEAPDRVRELEAWGAVFDRTGDGRILQRNFGGHRYPRLAHVGDRTGLELIRTLQDHGIHQGIDVHMECTVITLLKDGNRVTGALAYERERGKFRLFKAGAVILATGGIGRAYHQFKQLADIDITEHAMEVGPTTHYMMGGVLVDAETQMSSIDGLFAAGECASGINGANRLGGNSLSDLLVFGKRAGEHAASFAREHGPGLIDEDQIGRAARGALEPFDRTDGDNPYQIQRELQETMQELVGIVRREEEMLRALTANRAVLGTSGSRIGAR